jgi:hypothetical protein
MKRRTLLKVMAGLIGALVIACVAGIALAATGSPEACGSGDSGGVGLSELRAARDNVRNAGSISRRQTYSERVATQLVREDAHLRSRRVDLDDIKVGFCNGRVEASSTLSLLTGIRSKVVADLVVEDGAIAYDIRSARVGRLPSSISNWIAPRLVARDGSNRIKLVRDVTDVKVGNGTIAITFR